MLFFARKNTFIKTSNLTQLRHFTSNLTTRSYLEISISPMAHHHPLPSITLNFSNHSPQTFAKSFPKTLPKLFFSFWNSISLLLFLPLWMSRQKMSSRRQLNCVKTLSLAAHSHRFFQFQCCITSVHIKAWLPVGAWRSMKLVDASSPVRLRA